MALEVIRLRTSSHDQLIDITSEVERVLKKYPNAELVVVYVPHTTAAVTINEGYDPTVASDIITALRSWGFEKLPFRHMEGNSPSHSKSAIVGPSVTIPVENGKLMLGRWQSIFFCEFDGPRSREVYVKVISCK